MCIYLWLYEQCSEFNLVLEIKDQGTARVPIDYIKIKLPTLVSHHTARHHLIL